MSDKSIAILKEKLDRLFHDNDDQESVITAISILDVLFLASNTNIKTFANYFNKLAHIMSVMSDREEFFERCCHLLCSAGLCGDEKDRSEMVRAGLFKALIAKEPTWESLGALMNMFYYPSNSVKVVIIDDEQHVAFTLSSFLAQLRAKIGTEKTKFVMRALSFLIYYGSRRSSFKSSFKINLDSFVQSVLARPDCDFRMSRYLLDLLPCYHVGDSTSEIVIDRVAELYNGTRAKEITNALDLLPETNKTRYLKAHVAKDLDSAEATVPYDTETHREYRGECLTAVFCSLLDC